jgi:hypothetical protein
MVKGAVGETAEMGWREPVKEGPPREQGLLAVKDHG